MRAPESKPLISRQKLGWARVPGLHTCCVAAAVSLGGSVDRIAKHLERRNHDQAMTERDQTLRASAFKVVEVVSRVAPTRLASSFCEIESRCRSDRDSGFRRASSSR